MIGAEFYVMRLVAGRVHWNAALPDLAPERRRAVFEAMVDTLAALHSIEPAGVGLGDYGKPGNYFARQIDRWSRQIEASRTGEQPLLDRLTAFLPTAIPEQTRVSVVHGDFRLDNLIFAADTDRVAAVLDWELSTLGDPLADATYLFMNWVMPIDGRSGMAGLDLAALGIPALEEAVARYCAATGRDGLPNLDWYFAYNLFRLAAILQGIAGRVRDGTAASPEARRMITMIEPLSEAAWSFARKCGRDAVRIDWPGLKTLAFELGLPNVIETTAWDNPCLKAHGKMWTWWSASADAPVFKVSRDERDVLLDAGGDEFFVTDHYRPHGLVLVRPDRFDRDGHART